MNSLTIFKDLSVPSRLRRLELLEQLSQDNSIEHDVIEKLVLVENVPSTIVNYRDREIHLEALLKTLRQDASSKCKTTQIIALRCLFGSLYVNFEKFWAPTIRVIEDTIKQSRFQPALMEILVQHLSETSDIIYNGTELASSPEDRPDHILHRSFIIQIISKFQSNLENNNELFMNEFFRFAEKELRVSPFIETYIRDNLIEKSVDSTKTTKRKTKDTLLILTKIIQSFNDYRNIHRHSELRHLLLDLLCCRDASIQKASFNCIVVFEEDNLKPHLERISKIISDKMVRTEMTMFSIEDESTNRSDLMSILLRVLFGKMIGKIGRKSTGKNKAEHRKDLVMRFISGCTQEEILYFFSLLFDPIFKYANVDSDQLERNLICNMDFREFVPLNKLQAMLSSISSYMKSVAHRKEGSLYYVLRMINVIMFHIVYPLDNETIFSKLSDKSIETLKNLRRYCMNIVCDFFDMFSYYDYSQDEIDFIFKNLIWVSTQDFVNRNYATITPLLKLIESFSSNRVYHSLLIKRNRLDKNEYLLRDIVELYKEPKTTREVNKFIASILANILEPERTLDLEDDHETMEQMQNVQVFKDVESMMPELVVSTYNLGDNLKYNERILIYFIQDILEVLKRNCQLFLDKKDVTNRIENDELLLLSKLSVYLKSSKQCLLAARLLLTTLPYQKKPELIMGTLKTIQTLITYVEHIDDPTVVSLLAELISYQHNPEQRRQLCTIISLLSNVDVNLKTVAEAIDLMNRSAGDMQDRPDYEKCNDGFQIVFSYINTLNEDVMNNPSIVRDPILLLISQSCYMINNMDKFEFTTRENCSIFFEKLASKLKLIDTSKNGDLSNSIIEDILLNKIIKKGFRETNETIKHTSIAILRSLAMHCHQTNKTLGELYKFCNNNEDLDFWLNIKHIQLHNRSKALARIIESGEIQNTSSKTLSRFIMPLAAGFLFSKAYKSLSSLTENSIKLIGMISKQLNWVRYQSTLSYYLGLLTKANATYQKTNIKLITAILRNFNFDITSCKEAMEQEEENAKLEKRMKKRMGAHKESDHTGAIATGVPSGKKLNPSTAKMVYFAVTKTLIPRLNSCLHEMTRVEFEHDKNMANYLPEKDEIKRVPIAYAIIQLLNLLPNRYILFRDHLPTLFLKLCSFLKSKNQDIRKAARATVIKIMNFIGPAYMPDFLRVLKQNLDKGFQIHVLNYTIHAVLAKLPLSYGALDNSVEELVNSSFQEIFGKIAEDKEVAKILAKTYEAKKTKSYDTLFILSSYISAEKLDYLMDYIKETIKTSDEGKKVNKLALVIQKVFNGLAQNDNFPLDKLLDLIHMLILENMPNLKVRKEIESAVNKEIGNGNGTKREDRYLIGKDFSRHRVQSKINEKGNSHMIVENCLRLLFLTLENNKDILKGEQKGKLDRFIDLLAVCLKSSSPRCVTRALKCIHFIVHAKPDLPTLKLKSNSIMKKIFILLSLYNGVGMAQGDNFEMIGMCFKTLSLMLTRCNNSNLNNTQIRVLLTYIEQDLHDVNRQSTAFGTLLSLLHKKYNSPELPDILTKVSDLLITSDDDNVRNMSIKIWQAYLMDYQHPPQKLQIYLSKFLRQLDYQHIDGRRSLLKMLTVIVTKFPENLLSEYFFLIFHLLAQRVVNEDSKEVREIVSKLLGLLLQRMPDQQSTVFNKFIIVWASNSESKELRLLGIKLVSIFVECCKSVLKADKDKIKRVLHIIFDCLSVVNDKVESETTSCDNTINIQEKLNYHALRLFKRLLDKQLTTAIDEGNIDSLGKIWQNISSQRLCDSHMPNILTSCQLYSIFIKQTDLANALNAINPSTDNYLEWNAKRIVRTLCDRYIDLLDKAEESEQLLAYISQGMVVLGQMVANSKATIEFEQAYMGSFEDKDVIKFLLELKELPNNGFVEDHLPYNLVESKKRVDLAWLSLKVIMQARKEAALYRLNKYYRRNFVLSWTASIAQQLGAQRIHPYVILFSMTPIRELTDKGLDDANVKAYSEDLMKFMKGLMSIKTFNMVYSRLQLHFTAKRIDRKKKVLLNRVVNPERGTKRKLKENKKKTLKRKFKKIKE